MEDPVAGYDASADELLDRYDRLGSEAIHAGVSRFLPEAGGVVLDVGAGSGRDAAWLRGRGLDVVAVEPARRMREGAQARRSDPGTRWIDDRLPELGAVHALGLSYDAILLSAVFMHVPPADRPKAFRRLTALLKPGGVLLMSVRTGTGPPGRPMWPVAQAEIEALARRQGLAVLEVGERPDHQGRDDVHWTIFVLRQPDDGSGALPLLRGIILNDEKSSTYKLALLRCLARIAETAPALAVERPADDVVDLPLGAVALNWLRMYLPLVRASLPQLPGNRGSERLGFAGEGFRHLLSDGVIAQDLRIGAQFTGSRAEALGRALADARTTIARMPVAYTRNPNSDRPVFETTTGRAPRCLDELTLDAETLGRYGRISVPGDVWRTLQRLGPWIEPVLVSEWSRLVTGFGLRMGRHVSPGEVETALIWLDPERDTLLARRRAHAIMASGEPIRCVWSGDSLSPESLDVDHCLPWAAWPCGDLWNLMPARPSVNRNAKRDRLPSAAALERSRELIQHWWTQGWSRDETLSARFWREAEASLPLSVGRGFDALFEGLHWRRLRLRQDQQVREWAGVVG